MWLIALIANFAITLGLLWLLLRGMSLAKTGASGCRNWLKRNRRNKNAQNRTGFRIKFCVCVICTIFCVIMTGAVFSLSAIVTFAMTSDEKKLGIELVTDMLDQTEYEKDPVTYKSDVIKDEIIVYENEKQRGLFMELKQKASVERITKEALQLYREYMNQSISIHGATINPMLIFENDEDVDYSRLLELEAEIKSYPDPGDVPIEIYKEEYEIRRQAYSKVHSAKNAYQTGRTADDIFHILYLGYKQNYGVIEEQKKGSEDELFYYASSAIIYYNESLKSDNTEESRNDVLFKMGLIFQKLYLLSDVLDETSVEIQEQQATNSNKIHFLLLAKVFFESCRYYDDSDNLCWNQFNYYYGCNLHAAGLSAETGYGKELWKEAVVYLQCYIDREELEDTEKQDKKLLEDSRYRIELLTPYIEENEP